MPPMTNYSTLAKWYIEETHKKKIANKNTRDGHGTTTTTARGKLEDSPELGLVLAPAEREKAASRFSVMVAGRGVLYKISTNRLSILIVQSMVLVSDAKQLLFINR